MITIKRKLIDGRIISYTGREGEVMRPGGWQDEEGKEVPIGSICRPFDDMQWQHAYNDKGERITL